MTEARAAWTYELNLLSNMSSVPSSGLLDRLFLAFYYNAVWKDACTFRISLYLCSLNINRWVIWLTGTFLLLVNFYSTGICV